MGHENQIISIGVLAYSGAQEAAIYGLIDFLSIANSLSQSEGAAKRALIVERIRVIDEQAYDVIILPPSLAEPLLGDELAQTSAWIKSQHQRGALICSVCKGALLLAATGLLDHRPATTHWGVAESFKENYPDVLLDIDQLIIDDGDIITAGGLMAWTDLALKLIDRFLGATLMLKTARYFLVDPGKREQRFYSVFSPSLAHGDAVILKTQHWLQQKSSSHISVTELAKFAGLGERTFLRRFHKATGLNPSEYLQHLRIGKARELMELSHQTIDEISWCVGYRDSSAFRRVFHRIMGLTPSEYKRRFSNGSLVNAQSS